jgi:hypothetical protein
MARSRLHRGAAIRRTQFNRPDKDEAPEAIAYPGAAAAHHLHIGIVVGHAGSGRADRQPRVQAHSGRPKIDARVPTLPPHDLATNRPVSEQVSKRSVGNIAVRGPEKWKHYASSRSATREHKHAANSSTATSTARHHGATDYLAHDISDGHPLDLED